MKVNFLTKANANLASHRLRVLVPVGYITNNKKEITPVISDALDPTADITIFQKDFVGLQGVADTFLFKEQHKKIIVQDICDDHFDRPQGEYYKEMAKIADFITTNTQAMANRVKEVTGRDCFVIPDPFTFELKKPVVRKTKKPVLGWFGHITNIFSILPVINKYPDHKFVVVTNQVPSFDKIGANVTIIEWNQRTVEKVISKCDAIVLPKQEEAWAATKSPNRLIDSLAAGKLVISDDWKVKDEFHPFIYYGDIGEGIKYLNNYTDKIPSMIEEGQDYIKRQYSTDVIGNLWAHYLKMFKETVQQ